MQRITLDQLRTIKAAGGIQSVTLAGKGGGFYIHAATRLGEEAALMTQRGELRRFVQINQAMTMLRDLGIFDVRVDLHEWAPEKAQAERITRPDRREALKRTHEAAAHDAWFRQHVEQALVEANAPDAVWVSNDDIKKQSAAYRERWLQQAENAADVT